MKITNRQAFHGYKILETLECGIALTGSEVKSIRAGRVDLSNSFARITNGEVYLVNAYIYPYLGAREDYIPNKTRKLLLHKQQINNLIGKVTAKGKTLIPLSIYSKNNYFKIDLAVAESKTKYDHRKAIKQKDEQKKLELELKEF